MNLEKVISKNSRACAPVSAYKFNSDSITWEMCAAVKSKLSVACSYYVDYKYSPAHEGAVLIEVDGNIQYKDSVLAAQLKAKEIVLIGSLQPQFRIAMQSKLLSKINQHAAHRMLSVSLHESVMTGICQQCNGTGEKIEPINGVASIAECDHCAGSGRETMTPTEICKMLSVNRSNWRKDHLPKFNLFRKIFADLQQEFEKEISYLN